MRKRPATSENIHPPTDKSQGDKFKVTKSYNKLLDRHHTWSIGRSIRSVGSFGYDSYKIVIK